MNCYLCNKPVDKSKEAYGKTGKGLVHQACHEKEFAGKKGRRPNWIIPTAKVLVTATLTKSKPTVVENAIQPDGKKKRGRPKGSKNKDTIIAESNGTLRHFCSIGKNMVKIYRFNGKLITEEEVKLLATKEGFSAPPIEDWSCEAGLFMYWKYPESFKFVRYVEFNDINKEKIKNNIVPMDEVIVPVE